MYPKYNPTYDETKIIKLHYKHMQIHSRAPCNKLISQNNQVWWTHVNINIEKPTPGPVKLSNRREMRVSAAKWCTKSLRFSPQKMNVCMCMYACSYKPICAASGTATRPGGGGLEDAFLRTLTPFDPAQPKKKWKNVERVIADWQTDTVEGKSTVWQTAEAVGESDSDGGRERKTKRQTEIRQMEWDTDTGWPRPCLHQKCLCARLTSQPR